jgi:type II secretory pathway pseudopilin PulG
MKHNTHKQRGLSLIQIMVILAVVGIVVSMVATQLLQRS